MLTGQGPRLGGLQGSRSAGRSDGKRALTGEPVKSQPFMNPLGMHATVGKLNRGAQALGPISDQEMKAKKRQASIFLQQLGQLMHGKEESCGCMTCPTGNE
ncbi:hypothetical protein lerEdw1_018733 [Lerista edwardsae]|nr:hypothetical protein lerEdw1_018733 [Lerista edwardsae]